MGHASAEAALRNQHATRDRDAVLAAALGELVEDAKSVFEYGLRAINARWNRFERIPDSPAVRPGTP